MIKCKPSYHNILHIAFPPPMSAKKKPKSRNIGNGVEA